MQLTEYRIKADVKRPLTFAFVSDLHDAPNGPIIKAIRTSRADAVLVGGDFIHNHEIYERGFEFLRLSAKLKPTFCSIGNHERKFTGDLVSRVNESGAVLLDNSYTCFEGVNIGGLSSGYASGERQSHFLSTPAPDTLFPTEFASLDGFKILLSHHPEYYPKYIKELPIDLTLSGHAHGGQWRFFGMGVYAPGQGIFPKYTSGMHDGRFIVSRGLSERCKIPRINNKTEIIIIKLVKE